MTEDIRKERYQRLQFLLSKSNMYTTYLIERMKRQEEEENRKMERRAKRAERLQKKAEEAAAAAAEATKVSCELGLTLSLPKPNDLFQYLPGLHGSHGIPDRAILSVMRQNIRWNHSVKGS